ncbi:hypothetical protein GUJ93_ZPchr0013g33977 [Zizania palustris]|uniref:Uncharacterized protein n=1 Tax=Zizania palustris TaxID=103762 RepID=A0A8J5WWQ5_ZIZPA|nr:hypothetical protein GUJ93_ZPchr0013g33977 [Zizania palustris]
MAAPFGDVPASGTAYRASSTSPSAAPFDNVRSSLPGKTMDAQISSPSYRRSVAVTGVHAGIVDALESSEGFMSYILNQQTNLPQNSHFVGHATTTQNSPIDIQGEEPDEEDGDEVRTVARLIWKQEDGRVVHL